MWSTVGLLEIFSHKTGSTMRSGALQMYSVEKVWHDFSLKRLQEFALNKYTLMIFLPVENEKGGDGVE